MSKGVYKNASPHGVTSIPAYYSVVETLDTNYNETILELQCHGIIRKYKVCMNCRPKMKTYGRYTHEGWRYISYVVSETTDTQSVSLL